MCAMRLANFLFSFSKELDISATEKIICIPYCHSYSLYTHSDCHCVCTMKTIFFLSQTKCRIYYSCTVASIGRKKRNVFQAFCLTKREACYSCFAFVVRQIHFWHIYSRLEWQLIIIIILLLLFDTLYYSISSNEIKLQIILKYWVVNGNGIICRLIFEANRIFE